MKFKLLDSLHDEKTEWRCKIVKFRMDYDGVKYYKVHWRSTLLPSGNKWGARKISWRDSWEPESNISAKAIRSLNKKNN